MLSIAKMGKNSLDYYADLAREDYYLKGGEPPGLWMGRGAASLGLGATVQKEDFHNVFQGFSPDGTSMLVQNAGTEDRHFGSDLTFSAPKSVSVLWSQSDPERRAKIEKQVVSAARDALQYLEDNAIFTRRGRGGAITERGAGMVSALFLHGTSRAQDPQLHVHSLVANLVLRKDGTWGSMRGITSRKYKEDRLRTRLPLYREKMAAGALFRASLASGLEKELGFAIRRKGNSFEVEGVPAELMRRFSTRRREIEEALVGVKEHSSKVAAKATILTRRPKVLVPRKELFRRWQEQAKGFDLSAAMKPQLPRDPEKEVTATIEAAKQKLETEKTPPTMSRAVRRVAEEAQGRGVDAGAVMAALERVFTVPPRAPLDRATDREARAANKIVRRAAKKRDQAVGSPNAYVAQKQVEYLRGQKFSSEEREALAQITKARGSIQVLPSSPKISAGDVLSGARLAWERAGYNVLLVTPSRASADSWKEKTGLHSITLSGLIRGLTTNRGLLRGYDSALKNSLRHGLRGFPSTESFLRYVVKASGKWISFDEKTVLVLDRPRALSIGLLADLMKRVDQAGAKLVLLDETPRAHHREASAEAISRLLGAKQIRAELEQVLRHQEEQMERER